MNAALHAVIGTTVGRNENLVNQFIFYIIMLLVILLLIVQANPQREKQQDWKHRKYRKGPDKRRPNTMGKIKSNIPDNKFL